MLKTFALLHYSRPVLAVSWRKAHIVFQRQDRSARLVRLHVGDDLCEQVKRLPARYLIGITIGVSLVVGTLGGNLSSANLGFGEFQDFKLVVADTDDQSPLFIPMLSGQRHCAFSVYKTGKIGRRDGIEFLNLLIAWHVSQ